MSRFNLVIAAAVMSVLVLAACSAGQIAPTATPSGSPDVFVPSPEPTVTPLPSVSPPPGTPAPTEPPVIATPRPTEPGFTADEQDLLDGVQRDAEDCRPASDSNELPAGAIAGIECDSSDPAVARMGFYLFADDDDMLDAYASRMRAEGVPLDSGSCDGGEAERPYFPGEGFIAERAGCFINDEGFANYRYTIPGDHVYVGILGRSADVTALEAFAWRGNLDTPGIPTLWFGGID